MRDLRFTLRLLRARPGFTAAAILPLAAAIACTAAVFSLVDGVLYRPLGVHDPGRLAAIYGYSRSKLGYLSVSLPEFREIAQLDGVFESVGAFVRVPMNADLGGGAERFGSELGSGGYFQTLGVTPAIGRTLGPEDERAGAPPAVLLSDALWYSRFGRNPAVLGSVVRIADTAFTVVGVMPRGYVGTLLDWGAAPSLWLPLRYIERLAPGFERVDYRNRREIRWLMVIARLRPGHSVPEAQAALDVVEAREHADGRDHRLVALPSGRARFFPAYRETAVRFLSLLAAVAAAVLLIACFNLVNLLLARVAAREKETATRLALGARRGAIFRQFLAESLVLTGGAVAIGLPASLWLARWLAMFPQFLSISLNLDPAPDARALLASAAAAMAAGGLIGVVSAVRAGRTDLLTGLQNAGASPTGRGFAFLPGARDLFVAAQVACAMVVLISAVLLGRSLRDLGNAQLGYQTRGILLATLDISRLRRTPAESRQFYGELLRELRTGTRGAALAWDPLPGNLRWTRQLTAEASRAPATEVEGNIVSDGFFAFLGMPIEAGREFTAAEDAPAIIVNHTAASLFWPGENPVGRAIRIGGEAAPRTVVGVAADAQYHPLANRPIPYFFLPLGQALRTEATLAVRTPRAPLEYAGALRRAVRESGRDASLYGMRTMEAQVESGYAQVRLAAAATAAVGILGTLLALGGVFAMTAWRVVQQRREIAIRIALGAEHRQVVSAFAVKGVAIGAVGAVAGAVLAVWTTGLLRSSLNGIGAPDAFLFAGAAVLLLALVCAASVLPARRILLIDPAVLLRSQ